MREIARRLKRIAFGWSPKRAAKMTRIILKRFTSAGEWVQFLRKLGHDVVVVAAL